MSTTSKKPKMLSASSLAKLVAKHATRAQAKKTSGYSKHTSKSNPKLNAVPDQHNMLLDEIVIAGNYNMIFCN